MKDLPTPCQHSLLLANYCVMNYMYIHMYHMCIIIISYTYILCTNYMYDHVYNSMNKHHMYTCMLLTLYMYLKGIIQCHMLSLQTCTSQ